jgi:hypothetical protein
MRDARRRSTLLAVLALLLAACGPAGGSPSPSPTPVVTPALTPVVTPAATPTATPAATPTPTPTPAPTVLQRPPAPTNFTATTPSGTVPCPSPNSGDSCRQSDLAWQSTSAAGTWFKIYEAWTGEGGATCLDVQGEELVAVQTQPNARAAQIFNMLATGGGARCLWITAVNSVGESAQVPVAGQ